MIAVWMRSYDYNLFFTICYAPVKVDLHPPPQGIGSIGIFSKQYTKSTNPPQPEVILCDK